MKKVKLVKAIFTQEEIAAINTKNIKLEEENQKLKKNIERYEKEETRYINKIKNLEMIKKENESQISCYFKERDELREENRKLKDNYIKLSKIVETTGGYKASYVNELRDKIAKLESDTEAWKKAVREDKLYSKGEPAVSSGPCL